MSRVPCPIDGCPLPARSGYMCGGCEAELQRALASVPGVVDDLHVTLSRQTSRTTGGKGSETPLPYDARASEAMWVLRSALVGWVRVLQEVRGEPWPPDTLPGMAVWLSERLQRLVRHPAAPEAHGEITEAVRAAQRATDRPADRQFAGRCPGCGEALYAKPGASRVQCRDPECKTGPVEVKAQHDHMLNQIHDMLTHSTAAGAILRQIGVHVADSTIRYFAQEHRILARGHDRSGRIVYRVGDIVEELAKGKKKTAKR